MFHHFDSKILLIISKAFDHIGLRLLISIGLLVMNSYFDDYSQINKLSDEEREEQYLETDVTQFYSGYSVKLERPYFNLEAVSFNETFDTGAMPAPNMYARQLKIKNPDGEEIFNQQAPMFNRVYFDKASELFFFVEVIFFNSANLWVIDNKGNIKHQYQLSDFLYTEKEFESIFNVEEFSQSFELSMLNSDSSSEQEVEEEQVLIVFGCGAPRPWLNAIINVEFDDSNNLIGFYFQATDEIRYFDVQRFERKREEVKSIFENQIQTNYPIFCAEGSKYTIDLSFHYVHRWCEFSDGSKSGENQIWEFFAAENDVDFESHKQKFKSSNNFLLIGQGDYRNGHKNGQWTLMDVRSSIKTQCEFVDGKLHGQCLIEEEEYKTSYEFNTGLIHGVLRAYDNEQLVDACEYSFGYRSGNCTEYDGDFIVSNCVYQGESGIGFCTDYHDESNQIASECEMVHDQWHGLCTEYHQNGSIIKQSYYENDVELWSE